jgi:aminoglycoside/choline kinase family phosphotransferase
MSAYKNVLDTLVLWQNILAHDCAPVTSRSMNYEMFLWESSYFAEHCVSGLFGLDSMLTDAWEQQRQAIANEAALMPQVAIHRDFQSENICILNDGAVRLVDYQGARMGPPGYDVASLLYDPYVTLLADEERNKLLSYYREKSKITLSDNDYALCALQRLMQALGAYGNLSLNKGKPHYRYYVPIALERCLSIAQQLPEKASCLADILRACIQKQNGIPFLS